MKTMEINEMKVKMLFVIGSPRSGTTMLERILSAHSMIQGGPEPHLLTPLAHLGYWDNVDKAPYDHVLAAESQRIFIEQLPRGEEDYWDACRAYCDVLYGRYLSKSGLEICLDKTPAYGLILPFMMKVFPDAKYVVLTRHPLAIFSSFANSFFDGDYQIAQNYNPILNRYVPALAQFLRQKEVPFFHVKYEDLVKDSEKWVREMTSFIEIPFEEDMIDYGKKKPDPVKQKGLGDPIGVKQYSRPSTKSVSKWAKELAADPAKLKLMQSIIEQLDPEDLKTLGYPIETLWDPMKNLDKDNIKLPKPKLTKYRLQRKIIVRGRNFVQNNNLTKGILKKVALTCDVLLRE